MNKVELLEKKVKELENIIAMLNQTDRYTFQKDIDLFTERVIRIGNGGAIKQGSTAGFQINTDTSGKIAWNGYTPIVRPQMEAPSGGTTVDTEARAWIADVHNGLSNYGLFEAL